MEVTVPISIRYETTEPVPIGQVIEALQAFDQLTQDTTGLLTEVIPGLKISQRKVRVRELSEGSLKELLAVALIVAFQEDLEDTVPPVIEKLIGQEIPDDFHQLVTILFIIAAVYGAAAVKDIVTGNTAASGKLRKQFDGLVVDVSKLTAMPEDVVRERIKERYEKPGQMKRLSKAALKFFMPSKTQGDAPIAINERRLERDVVSDVPDQYLADDAMECEVYQDYIGVEMEIHAQDVDKKTTGWAAVVKKVSDDRLRVKLDKEVSQSQLWQKERVIADISVKYERDIGKLQPKEILVRRVYDD